jgi:hypothetical protein
VQSTRIKMASVPHIGRDLSVLCLICPGFAVTFAPYVRGGRRSRSRRGRAIPTVPSPNGKQPVALGVILPIAQSTRSIGVDCAMDMAPIDDGVLRVLKC